jgi:uncharacterized C2H2 Zn-finger protein
VYLPKRVKESPATIAAEKTVMENHRIMLQRLDLHRVDDLYRNLFDYQIVISEYRDNEFFLDCPMAIGIITRGFHSGVEKAYAWRINRLLPSAAYAIRVHKFEQIAVA